MLCNYILVILLFSKVKDKTFCDMIIVRKYNYYKKNTHSFNKQNVYTPLVRVAISLGLGVWIKYHHILTYTCKLDSYVKVN